MPIANKDPCEENRGDRVVVHFVLGGILRFSDDLRDFLGGLCFPTALVKYSEVTRAA
jgi:hypothetical protein